METEELVRFWSALIISQFWMAKDEAVYYALGGIWLLLAVLPPIFKHFSS